MPNPTIEDAEANVEKARALLADLEEKWHADEVEFDQLNAARRELGFRESVVDAMKKRDEARREQANAEAQRKTTEQKRRLKAEADLPVLETKLMLTENLRAALIDLHDAFPGPYEDPAKYALCVFVDTYLPEVTSGPGRGALDHVRHEVLNGASRGQVEALRKEIAEAKEVLAANNGKKVDA